MSTARRSSTRASDGGWTRISGAATSASSSSHPRAPGARSSSARASPRLPPARRRHPGRLRHRGGARRARRRRHRHERGLPRRHWWLQPLRCRRPGERSRSGAAHLRIVHGIPRPGRQRVAGAGDHQPAPGARRLGDDQLQLGRRIWRARFVVPRPPTASTRPGSAGRTRTGPTGTPRTWWRSRPAPSSRCDNTPVGGAPREDEPCGSNDHRAGAKGSASCRTSRRTPSPSVTVRSSATGSWRRSRARRRPPNGVQPGARVADIGCGPELVRPGSSSGSRASRTSERGLPSGTWRSFSGVIGRPCTSGLRPPTEVDDAAIAEVRDRALLLT